MQIAGKSSLINSWSALPPRRLALGRTGTWNIHLNAPNWNGLGIMMGMPERRELLQELERKQRELEQSAIPGSAP